MPIIYQPAPGTANLEVYGIEENTPYFAATAVQNAAGVSGFGDMNPTFFFYAHEDAQVDLGPGRRLCCPRLRARSWDRESSALALRLLL